MGDWCDGVKHEMSHVSANRSAGTMPTPGVCLTGYHQWWDHTWYTISESPDRRLGKRIKSKWLFNDRATAKLRERKVPKSFVGLSRSI